jgi:hypothetical protein
MRQQFGQRGYDRVLQEHRWEDKLEVVERAYAELTCSAVSQS